MVGTARRFYHLLATCCNAGLLPSEVLVHLPPGILTRSLRRCIAQLSVTIENSFVVYKRR